MVNTEEVARVSRKNLPKVVSRLVETWESPDQVKEDCKAIVRARLDRSRAKSDEAKSNTASADLTPVRNMLKELPIDSIPEDLRVYSPKLDAKVHLAYECLLIGAERREAQRIHQDSKRLERHETRAKSKSFDFESWHELSKVWIDSSDPVEAGIAVMIATGRRPVEVFGITEFKALDDNRCWVRGLAKKKAFDDECYIIPTLIDSESIAAAIERVRESLPASRWLENGDEAFNESPVYKKILTVYDSEFRGRFEDHGFTKEALRNFRYLYEAVIGELAEQQFSDRFRSSEYVARALSHEGMGSASSYTRFVIESLPSDLELPPFEAIGARGKEPADSPFSSKFTIDLAKLYELIAYHFQRVGSEKTAAITARLSEQMQQGRSIEEAIALELVSRETVASGAKVSVREQARDDVDTIVDAIIEHNLECRENAFKDEVFISFTLVQKILQRWKGKRLAASLWQKTEAKRSEDVNKHHSELGIFKEQNLSLRGNRMDAVIETITNNLNAKV